MQRKGHLYKEKDWCRGDAAPKAEIPLLRRKGRATLGNKAMCCLLTEDVVPPRREDIVPPPERRHAVPLGKYFLPTFWEVVTPLMLRDKYFRRDSEMSEKW